MTGHRGIPAEQPASRSHLMPGETSRPTAPGPRTGRDTALDAGVCLFAAALGGLFLVPTLKDVGNPLSNLQLTIDVSCGFLACVALWWRRRWPLGVALVCAVLGAASITATPAGLLALFSLALLRDARRALLVAALWIPSLLVFALYSPTTDALSVVLIVTPLVFAATAWGMFVRGRRQLLLTLRERTLRAEEAQRLQADRIRLAERTRIAREMHDVLGHRISLLALHAGALEFRPDLPPEKVRETAELMRSTARQALEELRAVIGVLRDETGQEATPAAPQPTLSDIPRLVRDTQRAGARIDFEMLVDHPETAPGALGRDAYRIVQEALTNIGKHARDSVGGVRVTGAADSGLHVRVRNRLPPGPLPGQPRPDLPLPDLSLAGSGAGLLGLQERVTLAGGTLVHGPDGSGDFVVDAELPW